MINRLIRILAVIALMGALFVGCSDKKNGPDGDDVAAFLRAVISGAVTLDFEASAPIGLYDEETMTVTGSMTVGANTYTLIVTIHTAPQTGTFNFVDILDDFEGNASGILTVNGATSYWSISGTITMTEAGDRFKGTFSFTAEDLVSPATVTVASGSFNVLAADVTE